MRLASLSPIGLAAIAAMLAAPGAAVAAPPKGQGVALAYDGLTVPVTL